MNAPVYPISYPRGAAWYVLAIEGRHVFQVEREIIHLQKMGAYVPRTLDTKVIRRRRVESSNPLFPGYGFVQFDIDRDDWPQILEIDGVIESWSHQQIHVRVPSLVIDRLKNAQNAGAFDNTKPSAAFSVGDSVEITEGPFAGLIAKIKSATKKKRVEVILNFLGGLTVFNIDTCDLAKV